MEKLELLYEYQTVELELEAYETELKNTPTRKKLLQLQRFLQGSQQKLVDMENAARIKQDKVSNLQSKSQEYVEQLDELRRDLSYFSECPIEEVAAKDVQEMVKNSEKLYDDIVAVKKQISQIRQEAEKTTDEVREILAKMKKAKKEFDELKAVYTTEVESGNEDLEKLKQKALAARKKVSPELLVLYQKIKGNRQNPVAILSGSRCGGCNMQLPSGISQTVKNSEKPTLCENCGRILMLKED